MRTLLTLIAFLLFAACKRETIPAEPAQTPDSSELDQRTYPALPKLFVPGNTKQVDP
jgi:hypothetical protein